MGEAEPSIEELVARCEQLSRRAGTLRPADYPNSTDPAALAAYLAAADEYRAIRDQLWNGPNDEIVRLSAGTAAAPDVEYALAYLEHDPYLFRSGYNKERIARFLARAALDPRQRARTRALVLRCVDHERHCPLPGIGRLARATADNELRRQLRARLHHDDSTARLALLVLANVRHPGLMIEDIRIAREIALQEAGARPDGLSNHAYRLGVWLWNPEWESELRDIARQHGARRAGAKRLLEAADRRRARQAKKRPGP